MLIKLGKLAAVDGPKLFQRRHGLSIVCGEGLVVTDALLFGLQCKNKLKIAGSFGLGDTAINPAHIAVIELTDPIIVDLGHTVSQQLLILLPENHKLWRLSMAHDRD